MKSLTLFIKESNMTNKKSVQDSQNPTRRSVQAYSLAEALKAAQDGALEGYSVDLESNEGYPQQFGSMIVFSLVKYTGVAVDTTNEAEVATEYVTGEATEVSSDVTVESVPEKKTRAKTQK